MSSFELRNVPLLSRIGADRADVLRTDVEAATAGWADALLLRVDSRNQVLISDGRVVLGKAAKLADQPPANAVFLGRLEDGRHVWAVRGALEGPDDPHADSEVLDLRRAGHIFDDVSAQLVASATALLDAYGIAVAPSRTARTADEAMDGAAVFFTSGTTGQPKGCMISHANLCAQVEAFDDRIPLDETCRLGSILPLSHLFELTCGLLYPMLRGAAVHYIPSRRGADIVRVLQEQRVTHMMAVPQLLTLMGNALEQRLQSRLPAPIYAQLLRLADRSPMAIRRRLFFLVHRQIGGCLRLLAAGGAALPLATQQLWERLGVGHSIGDVGIDDLPLGTHDALRHGRLGNQERCRDLRGGEARYRAQRERHLCLLRKRGVAARENEPQPVIHLNGIRGHGRALQQLDLFLVALVAPQDVDRLAFGGGHQPRARLVGDALGRPSFQRRHDAVLDHFLGNVEVADDPDESAGQPSRLLAENVGKRCLGGCACIRQNLQLSTTGRTSTLVWPGHVLAISSASSRSATSRTANPPMTSLASMKGPSTTMGLPSLNRTVVAVCVPWSSSPLMILPARP